MNALATQRTRGLPGSVHLSVLGDRVVPEDWFEARIGKPAYRVWAALILRRDYQGVTNAKRTTIANAPGFVRMSERAVERALIRLRAAGLVEDMCKRRRRNSVEGAAPWVYPRRVYGGRSVPAPDMPAVVFVPERIHAWLQTANTRGGIRSGAGRRRSAEPKKNQRGGYEKRIKGVHVLRINGSSSDELLETSSAFGTPALRAGPVATPPTPSTYDNPTIKPYVQFGAPMPSLPPGLIGKQTESGLCFPGTVAAAPTKVPRPGTDGVPSYPGPTVMRAAETPPPPRFRSTQSQGERVTWLLNYYRGAFDSRYKPKTRCGVFRRPGQLESNKRVHTMLLDFIELATNTEIRPAAWVAWRFDMWIQEHGKNERNPPPMQYVFHVTHLEKHLSWFDSESGSYMGGRLVYGDAAKELMTKYAHMQRALVWGRPANAEETRKIIDQHLPRREYERLLDLANATAAQDMELMTSAAQQGQWVDW